VGFRFTNCGLWVIGLGFIVWNPDLGVRVQRLGFRVDRLGFEVLGLGGGVWDLGFRV